MKAFSRIWKGEVKPIAKACVMETKLIQIMDKGEDYSLSDEEMKYINEIFTKYNDLNAMYDISKMIHRVDGALSCGKKELALIEVDRVYDYINSPTYFTRVFDDGKNDAELKNMIALRDGLRKLICC